MNHARRIRLAAIVLLAGSIGGVGVGRAADMSGESRASRPLDVHVYAPLPGVPVSEPSCRAVSNTDTRDIWLGHFTGGRKDFSNPQAANVDWRDDYACFDSRVECHRWQRDLRTAYHAVEGYRTCLPIR